MNRITCEECNKFLFETEKDGGAAGAEAYRLGFVWKLPVLYGLDGSHFFCTKECWNKWLLARTDKEARDKGDSAVKELKRRMEQSKPEIVKGLIHIQNSFRNGR